MTKFTRKRDLSESGKQPRAYHDSPPERLEEGRHQKVRIAAGESLEFRRRFVRSRLADARKDATTTRECVLHRAMSNPRQEMWIESWFRVHTRPRPIERRVLIRGDLTASNIALATSATSECDQQRRAALPAAESSQPVLRAPTANDGSAD